MLGALHHTILEWLHLPRGLIMLVSVYVLYVGALTIAMKLLDASFDPESSCVYVYLNL